MTFQQGTIAVDGGRVTGQLWRQQLRSATRSRQGIILPLDLEVTELSTPGTSVRIRDGDGVILGREVANQGSYYFSNVGDETVPIAATGSGETRSDLVVARAEDPTFSGSPWTHDPASQRIVWPRVIANVPPGTQSLQEVEPGQSGATLARIDIPASTATITNDMIFGLRQLLDPITEYVQESKQHSATAEEISSTSYVDFPAENGSVQVAVPPWATWADVNIMIVSPYATSDTETNIFGNIRALLAGADVAGFSEFNVDWNGGKTRFVAGAAGNFVDVQPYQGQTVTLKTQARVQGGGDAIGADNGTNVIFQVFFQHGVSVSFG